MHATEWNQTLALLVVLGPLYAVPSALLLFYLKALRDHLSIRHADLARRIDRVEHATAELRRGIGDFERDYATKEEWLRECMWTRRSLERSTRALARFDAAPRYEATATQEPSAAVHSATESPVRVPSTHG
jgi:hypothetical protein